MLRGLVVCFILGANALEPGCINNWPSRFDYERTLLEKLVYLEQFKSETTAKLAAQQQQMQELYSILRPQAASTYVNWGMQTCPNVTGTTQVYTGQVAGGHYSHAGSGEYICLPNDPEYDQYNDTIDEWRSSLYGAEYETDFINFKALYNHDVPCSVCLSKGKTTLMIPGRISCYTGWIKEYQGYLMGEYYKSNGKGYVCMNKEAESMPSSNAGMNGALFYPVEGRCGSLKCPPYTDGRELACVVCSFST
ncbi:uncharacterized protein LOC127881967 [Dreissena polymorpha]|uniref:Uncharacterized protein n=1 Tax=Dreissena polymorpha TaxID=45954 RepID=A0A9D4H1Q2_DREPO|nr:uncharacterized protein LOC127881967 [Dreissena polymorpha]KAH3825840.1 hypothetical protein DPMN_127723 [Dreissena polymorpha]